MKYLGKIDEFIIDVLQGAYLKLLDYTGIYVASIMSAIFVLAMGVGVIHSDWLGVGMLGFNGLLICPARWAWQHNKEDFYNKITLTYRNQKFRKFACLTSVTVLIPASFFVGDVAACLTFQLAILTSVYLSCILIRKREPKEFFKRAPALSLQVGS